jgi:methionine--tRNA ligase beta chain
VAFWEIRVDSDLGKKITTLKGETVDMSEEKMQQDQPLEPAMENPAPEKKDDRISIEDVMKLDLRIAEIIAAEEHPNADKLLVLKIKIADEERQLVAGIRKAYDAQSLVGKKIVIVANLKPAVLRGIESQGMLLAASSDDQVVLLSPEKDIASGSKVK